MKTFLISLAMTVLLLLLESASGQECESRYFSLDYCGSTYTNCTYSIFKYHEPKSNLVSSIGRGCGESTKQVCKGKDWLGCMNSPQCVWWQTYSRDDPTKGDEGCREFDCSYGLTEDYCGQFKDCVFDKKDSECRSKKQPKKSLWEIINDHAETATGKRLDGK